MGMNNIPCCNMYNWSGLRFSKVKLITVNKPRVHTSRTITETSGGYRKKNTACCNSVHFFQSEGCVHQLLRSILETSGLKKQFTTQIW